MIRINLLGQARPKAAKQAVPVEATVRVLMLIGALAAAFIVLFVVYVGQNKELTATKQKISDLQAEKARLQQIKLQVQQFESEKADSAAADQRDRRAAKGTHGRAGTADRGGVTWRARTECG